MSMDFDNIMSNVRKAMKLQQKYGGCDTIIMNQNTFDYMKHEAQRYDVYPPAKKRSWTVYGLTIRINNKFSDGDFAICNSVNCRPKEMLRKLVVYDEDKLSDGLRKAGDDERLQGI